VRRNPRLRYWLIISIFTALAITLFTINAEIKLKPQFHDFTQAVAEALVVAVVVSLAVEPRLLRYFGEELASQTFWASFYSRAPEAYREAIKELASADQFQVATDWTATLDWADENKSIIKLTITSTSHRENRSSKSHACKALNSVYQSRFPGRDAEYLRYSLTCPGDNYDVDLIREGRVKVGDGSDGRLMMVGAEGPDSSYYDVPAGMRYTIKVEAVTYVDPMDHFPFVIVRPTLKFTIQLKGNALDDLFLSIVHPGSGTAATDLKGPGKELKEKGPIPIGEEFKTEAFKTGVFITGTAILLSWKPLPGRGRS
jgi:hypothetical protein